MRDDFTKDVLDMLAKRVGYHCSNPECVKHTSGPRTESDKSVSIGVGSHITAASPKGPRYDSSLSTMERCSADNGIWLCENCAKLVDNDVQRYPVEKLRDWKCQAEKLALASIGRSEVSSGASAKNSLDIDISYKCVKTLSERHDYTLETKVCNRGCEHSSRVRQH